MRISHLNTRRKRIERRAPARDSGQGTLEALCRTMWRGDHAGYLEMAQEPGEYTLRTWIPLFEGEDARRQDLPANRVQSR
jgi:hypothetical protein